MCILTDTMSNQIPAINSRNNNTNSQTPHQATQPSSHVQQRFSQNNKNNNNNNNQSQQQPNRLSNGTNSHPNSTSRSSQVPQSTTVTLAKDTNNRRKDNIGSNGLRLFEKLTSVIYTPESKNMNCLGSLVGGRKKDVTSGTLYNLLAACLDSMPDGECLSMRQ